ncbi:carboxylic acid transporter protein [Suillus clintonianus]|uniref:carboxylic acid transporter protein n=1 Tax=Suillus clintonianus TaxID=1904413 RepID=UPI001B8771BB|nr:carboxylic acid transporter protein [Suillus clintonianus]KAG2123831.1 carboxylic acid transporter protein [Suillus clintonianus]
MPPRFIRELVPRRENRAPLGAVVVALRSLTWVQWAQFLSGWFAWACDALDFVAVTLTIPLLSEQFGKSTSAVTTAFTLTLLFRSVGAVIFGMISDRFGRKWPLVINLIICGVLELGTGFVNTFQQFLALRALFGIAMGGIWGLSSSSALENLPVELRGIGSGVLQEGYAIGYLIAAVINLTLVAQHGWRALFWTGAGITFFAAVVRALIPESAFFLRKEQEKARGTNTSQNFLRETKEMLKLHWPLCIYAVLLMTGLNFLSHGSQDLYPTYLQITKGFSAHDATVATIISNCGGLVGGALGGWVSQYIGRRLTIVSSVLLVGVFIPLWVLPFSFSALSAGAFCIQVGVQGAWGVIPIQLAEMSPPAFRATFPGVVYQLGNMVSAASAQIEATGGDHLKTTIMENGVLTVVPDYATASHLWLRSHTVLFILHQVQAIFIGAVAAFVIVIAIIGPENHGSHFENADAASGDEVSTDNTSQKSYREVDEKSSV